MSIKILQSNKTLDTIKMIHINIKFISLLALFPLLGFAQTKTIRLIGTMDPSMNGKKITIIYGGFKKMVFDSARIQNGKVQFELKNADSTTVSLGTGDKVPRDNISIYIANADVYFKAKDSLKNAVLFGHQDTKDYQRMTTTISRLADQRYLLMGSPNLGPEIKAKMQELAKAEKTATYKAIDENPNSYVALMLLNNQAGGAISYDEMMPHFQKLSKELKNTSEGKALGEKIMLMKNLRSGLAANDFESLTPEGKTLKLYELLPKAKYTLVDFWASWCMPCRAENPNVVKAFEKYGNKGLTILSVSLDTKADPWKTAIKKDGMPWIHVSQLKGFDEPAAVLYGIKMIPQNVLIDSKGKIVATNLRGYALEDKLKQLFN